MFKRIIHKIFFLTKAFYSLTHHLLLKMSRVYFCGILHYYDVYAKYQLLLCACVVPKTKSKYPNDLLGLSLTIGPTSTIWMTLFWNLKYLPIDLIKFLKNSFIVLKCVRYTCLQVLWNHKANLLSLTLQSFAFWSFDVYQKTLSRFSIKQTSMIPT